MENKKELNENELEKVDGGARAANGVELMTIKAGIYVDDCVYSSPALNCNIDNSDK